MYSFVYSAYCTAYALTVWSWTGGVWSDQESLDVGAKLHSNSGRCSMVFHRREGFGFRISFRFSHTMATVWHHGDTLSYPWYPLDFDTFHSTSFSTIRSFLAYTISELVLDKPGVGKVWCCLPVLLLFNCRLYMVICLICCFCIEQKCVFFYRWIWSMQYIFPSVELARQKIHRRISSSVKSNSSWCRFHSCVTVAFVKIDFTANRYYWVTCKMQQVAYVMVHLTTPSDVVFSNDRSFSWGPDWKWRFSQYRN